MVLSENPGHSQAAISEMGFWCSLSVLALVGVTALGFPRPDEYKIPDIPYGSRAQFYVLHDDGTFKYGYDTGNGIYEKATKMGGNVNGYYGFTDAEGKNVRLDYTAGGEEGFVPKLSIDKTIFSPARPSVAQTRGSSPSDGLPTVKSAYDNSKISSGVKNDASYSFSYVNPDSSRREESDSDLNVKGEYSFIADDGVRRHVNYIAGSDTGFVAEGDFLPKAPEVPTTHGQVALIHVAPAHPKPTPIVKSVVEPSEISSGVRNDASYSFSYNTGDSSRKEEADADLNVKGEYSFVADDGIRRQVNYIAGSNTGFVALGDLLPKAPEVPAPHGQVAVTYVAPTHPEPTPIVKSVADPSEISSGVRNDASYSFSYNTGDSSRKEEADADLNVKGEYSFVADDGIRRQVNYIAGSDTGFVAEGDFLPKAPVFKHASVVHHSAVPVVSPKHSSDSSGVGYVSTFPRKSSPVLVKIADSSAGDQGIGAKKSNFYKGVVGDVLLRQYLNQGKEYGYVFTAV